ncbi:putative GTP-binding protein 6 [Erethizon dorsatum]
MQPGLSPSNPHPGCTATCICTALLHVHRHPGHDVYRLHRLLPSTPSPPLYRTPRRPVLVPPASVHQKTTLIRALTGDAAAQPRDQLFATLDVTAHVGWLPSCLPVLYVDTIGFLSQLPHGLIQAFSATLDNVAHSDIIVHVRDISHPERELQKASVLSTLQGLCLPDQLLHSMIEGHNKVDLVPGYSAPEPSALAVSALCRLGLEQLKARLEDAVLAATGRRALTFCVPLAGPQLSWLHWEAIVQDVTVQPEAGAALVTLISSSAAAPAQPLDPGRQFCSVPGCCRWNPGPVLPGEPSPLGSPARPGVAE